MVGGCPRAPAVVGLDELVLNDKGPRRRLCSVYKTSLPFVHLLQKAARSG